VAEALSQGLPVLTTRQAGAADLITEGENGFLVEAGSVEALRGKLEEIRGQRERLREMRPACLKTAGRNSQSRYQEILTEQIRAVLR